MNPLKSGKQRAVEFLSRTVPQSDETFFLGCRLPNHPEAMRVALAVRSVIAKLGKVPTECIRFDMRFSDGILSLPFWDSIEQVGYIIELEESLSLSLEESEISRIRNPDRYPNMTIRDFVMDVFQVARDKLEQQG